MCYTRGLDHPRAFQFNWLSAQVVEQSDTSTKKEGHQVNIYFVKNSGFEALLGNTSGTYSDILVPCDSFCLFNGAFNAIRDERERRSFLDPFLWDCMGNDKMRYTERGFAAPRTGDIERPPTRHQRPNPTK